MYIQLKKWYSTRKNHYYEKLFNLRKKAILIHANTFRGFWYSSIFSSTKEYTLFNSYRFLKLIEYLRQHPLIKPY